MAHTKHTFTRRTRHTHICRHIDECTGIRTIYIPWKWLIAQRKCLILGIFEKFHEGTLHGWSFSLSSKFRIVAHLSKVHTEVDFIKTWSLQNIVHIDIIITGTLWYIQWSVMNNNDECQSAYNRVHIFWQNNKHHIHIWLCILCKSYLTHILPGM